MAVDAPTFLLKFPEFGGVSSDAVQDQLDLAVLTLNQGRLGAWFERLAFLWSAHYLYLRFDMSTGLDDNGLAEQENQGVVTSQSASTSGMSVSTSVSGIVAGDNPLHSDMARTNYGMQYLSILRQILSPIV